MRWIVGLLLVVAAILKGVELVHEPAATLVSPLGRWFLPTQVGIELGIGLLVLAGLYWKQIRWCALLLFAAFAVYSLCLALGGAVTCGCFGPMKIHPWWTFLLDVVVVLGLLVSIRIGRHDFGAESHRHLRDLANRQAIVAAVACLSVVGTAVLARYVSTRTAAANDLLSTAGGLVVLEPEHWVGKPLPIADAIDLDLSEGKWIVLLHRHDCHDCQEAVPHYEHLAMEQQVALVEVPPYGPSEGATGGAAHFARLNTDREWFVQTPVEIQLSDGLVTSASTELPALFTATGR